MANAWFETVAEAQRRAKRRLPRGVYGALLAGAEKGLTVADNVAAFDEIGFAPTPPAWPTTGGWPPPCWARTSPCRC